MGNLIVYILIQFQKSSDLRVLLPAELIVFNKGKSKVKFDCREDEASMEILTLVFTESVVKLVSLVGLSSYSFYKKSRGRKDWQMSMTMSYEIVWVIYFQTVLWFSMVLYPYITVL